MFEHFQTWMDYAEFIDRQANGVKYRLKSGIPTCRDKKYKFQNKQAKANSSAIQNNLVKHLRIGRK